MKWLWIDKICCHKGQLQYWIFMVYWILCLCTTSRLPLFETSLSSQLEEQLHKVDKKKKQETVETVEITETTETKTVTEVT